MPSLQRNKIYVHKKLCLNVHRNIIYNSSKLQTTQISTNRQWTEETCHVICMREYSSATKTLNNDMHNNEKFQTKKEIRQEELNSLDYRKCRLIYSDRRVVVG